MQLSERLEELKKEISKVQYESNKLGYSIDLERILILMDSGVSTLKFYEEPDASDN